MTPITKIDLDQARRPGLLRRLAAIFYDSVLIFALWVIVFALLTPIEEAVEPANPNALYFAAAVETVETLAIISVMLAFHLGFWTHGGQSLGMRAWRLRVVRCDGSPLRLRDALVRYLAAWLSALCLGLGFLWSLWDREGYAWHDRLSGTRLVMVRRDA